MEDVKVSVEVDGKISTPNEYAIVYSDGDNISAASDAGVLLLGRATVIVYDLFLKEAARFSDQDLYHICDELDLNFDTIRPLVSEVRSNG